MSDFLRLLLIFLAAVNPPAMALGLAKSRMSFAPREPWLVVLLGAGIALGLIVLVASAADSLLDALDIAPESFRVAAGIVMGASGTFAVWSGRAGAVESESSGFRAALFPMAIPLLAGPASLITTVSYGADDGAAKTMGAAAIAVVLAAAIVGIRPAKAGAALDAGARLLGALLVAFACGLIVSGVRDI